MILATAKRHLDIASSFDCKDGAKEDVLSLCSYYQSSSFFQKQNSMCCLCHKSDTVFSEKRGGNSVIVPCRQLQFKSW